MRRRRPASLRLRLALLSAATAAVVLAVLAAVIAGQLRQAAAEEAAQLAAADLRSFAADLRAQPDEAPDVPAAGLLVLVVDPSGRVRRDSMPAALAEAVRSVRSTGEVTLPGGRFEAAGRAVAASGGTWRLWAARDASTGDALLAGVLTSVLVGSPLAVLLTGAAAWVVAGAALRPVERMRETAEALRDPGSTGVLPVQGGRELTGLAATLNALIGDLRSAAAHERRVTADAAHELRTPLAVLAAQVERAQRRPGRDDLAAIRASADRLTRLADGLLALARAEGPRSGATAASSVGDLVTEAMESVDRARELAPPGIAVDLHLGDGLDEHAVAGIDVASFGRVLANLLANALAAGPASAVDVRLGTADGRLALEVRDDGPGLPPDFLPFAFDRFSRPADATGSGAGGAGLGLALVRGLVQQAGGTAALENGDPRGAVATVRMPLDGGAASG